MPDRRALVRGAKVGPTSFVCHEGGGSIDDLEVPREEVLSEVGGFPEAGPGGDVVAGVAYNVAHGIATASLGIEANNFAGVGVGQIKEGV